MKRFYVSVSPEPPLPVFLSPVSISAGIIELGQTLTFTTSASNNGATSDDGRVVFSFPTLTDPADWQTVGWGTADDQPGYRMYPAGSALLTADCQPMTATYLTAEFADSSWLGPGTESNAVALTVRPRRTGTFAIEVRASMHAVGGGPCGYVNQVPSNGHSGFLDQQGYPVHRFNVTVLSTPAKSIPVFVGDVFVSTDAIGVGGALTITAVARNNGAWSDDGRIVLAFPSLDQAGDDQWVTTSSSGDTPGFRKYAVGASIRNRACETVAARHLVAEYADARWDSIGDETNTFTVTVRPPREGLFTIEVRTTMRTAGAGPCAYENTVPANGEGGFTDQQGWEVKRFEVYVGSTPSMTWRITGPSAGTPAARALQAAVYDAMRDEMVLYGGTALTYTGDSWALPLPGQQGWSQLQPGGPVPLRRIMHSMVHDPVNGNLVIFGGLYDDILDDLWVLARAPLSWWFPLSPAGDRPGARMGHSAVYDPVRQRMLVIGGFGRSLYNDVWEYSPMVNGTWRQLAPAGPPLPPRATFSAIYDPVRDRVLVFGGDGGVFLNDVWALELGGSLAWQPITPEGAPPGPRREHTAVYDPQWDEVVVFGGFNGTRRLNDVWTLSLSGTPRWERRFTESGSPVPRSGHSAVYDPVRQRMLVFGGQLSVNTYTNEVWELKIDRATPVTISLAETEVAPDHVRLSWFGEGVASLAASVERSTDEIEWIDLGAPSPQGPNHLEVMDRDVIEGRRYAYRLRVWQEGTAEVLGPVWVTVPVRAVLSLAGALPNPVSDAFTVAFSLPEEGRGALEVFDLRGRRVVQRDLTGLPAGPHRLALGEGRRLPAGIYWVRLTHRDRHLIAKACVVR